MLTFSEGWGSMLEPQIFSLTDSSEKHANRSTYNRDVGKEKNPFCGVRPKTKAHYGVLPTHLEN